MKVTEIIRAALTRLGIYATGVQREIDKIADLLNDATADGHDFIIECTTGISRNSGQTFFKIMVRSF